MIDLPFVPLEDGVTPPAYARDGDAGADLIAIEGATLVPRGGRALVRTGLSLAIPAGYAGFVLPRSGLAVNHGITCLNSPGLIDSGFRGEIRVILVNTDPDTPYEVHAGDRVAQFVLLRVEAANFLKRTDLPESTRGDGGFGHSGR